MPSNMRVTLRDGIRSEDGLSSYAKGSTQWVSRQYGALLVSQGAIDVDSALAAQPSDLSAPLVAALEQRGNGGLLRNTFGFDILCNDASGYFRDRSDSQNHLTPRTEITAPFANAGYFTSQAGANGFAFIPVEKFRFDMAMDSFVFSFTVKVAAPGANTPLVGNAAGTTLFGFYFSARTNGSLPVGFVGSGGAWTTPISSTTTQAVLGTALDGADHTVTIAYDAPTRSVFYWLDGVLKFCWPNVVLPGVSSLSNANLALGAQYGTAGVSAMAAQFKHIKARVFVDSGLPLNIGQLVKRMVSEPTGLGYLTDAMASPSRYVALAWGPAQSNEQGSSDLPESNHLIGCPVVDQVSSTGATVTAVGSTGSMHPGIAAQAARRGTWLQPINTAVGTTSAAEYWVGRISNWSFRSWSLGAYVLGSGRLYKMTASSGASPNLGASGGSAPTWPASGTVVDNQITWTFVRAATAADVVGVVSPDNPLFDPNGACAAIKAQLDALPSIFDKRVAISIGQGDFTVSSTLSEFRDALISAAGYFTSQGYKVLVGLTNSGSAAGFDAWLAAVGKPGMLAALDALKENPNVAAGADLATELGALTVQTNAVGVLADTLHMNHFARDRAVAVWDAALSAAGA